uniref:Uncharacterized protein n=1 Tax=Solanum tuberosum TaxID=4113 RepID=M1DFV1_SOLTU
MRAEMDKTRDLTNQAIIANSPTPNNERPPLSFPTSNPTSLKFPTNSSTPTISKPLIIDLTIPNPYHDSSSHQKLHIPQNPNINNLQNFPPVQQIPTQIVQSPPITQPIPLKTACYLSPESYPSSTTHFELDHYEMKEKEWKEYANDDSLGEGIGDLLENRDVMLKEMIKTSSILDIEPMEQVLNWTSTVLLIPRSS